MSNQQLCIPTESPCYKIVMANFSGQSSMKKRPHIIILLADDLGWNEVSWNNPLFLTPNLEVRSSYI